MINKENNPVRVSLPASVAADIGSLKKAVGSVLEHLGCQACCSGHDILFELQREIVFQKDFRSDFALPSKGIGKGYKVVEVDLNPDSAGKLDNVFDAIDRVARLTGHTACATGCDFRFRLERVLVLDEGLKINEMMGSIREGVGLRG